MSNLHIEVNLKEIHKEESDIETSVSDSLSYTHIYKNYIIFCYKFDYFL